MEKKKPRLQSKEFQGPQDPLETQVIFLLLELKYIRVTLNQTLRNI